MGPGIIVQNYYALVHQPNPFATNGLP